MGRENDGEMPRIESKAERAERISRLTIVSCKREFGPEVSIKIRNTSATGLRCECREVADFRPGEKVQLSFRNMAPVQASVAWCENEQVAFAFGKSIDIENLIQAHSKPALPDQSPRSETTMNWIDRVNRTEAYNRSLLDSSGKRPV